jgi:hypothetical protein
MIFIVIGFLARHYTESAANVFLARPSSPSDHVQGEIVEGILA